MIGQTSKSPTTEIREAFGERGGGTEVSRGRLEVTGDREGRR